MGGMDNVKELRIVITPELHREFKKACIDAEVTMAEAMRGMVERFVKGAKIREESLKQLDRAFEAEAEIGAQLAYGDGTSELGD